MDWSALRQSLLGTKSRRLVPPRVKLPILPLAVAKFSQAADAPNASPAVLGKIVETDSGLTCELLRYVNSSARGLSQKASTAQQAIALLGIRESKLYLLTKAVERAMRGRESKLINLRDFWMTNLERAVFAQQVARLLGADVDVAFAAGMLQDFLLPALTNDLFPVYLEFTKQQNERPIGLADYENRKQGWGHAEAAAHIMFGWGFPDDLVCCTFLHHQGLKLLKDERFNRTAAAAVAVSALMPDALRQVPDGLEQLIELDRRWKPFSLMEIAETVDRGFQELSAGPPNPFSFLRRCRKALASAAC